MVASTGRGTEPRSARDPAGIVWIEATDLAIKPKRTLDLLRRSAELREVREREHGPMTLEQRDPEAMASAHTAMALAGHPVAADLSGPAPAAV